MLDPEEVAPEVRLALGDSQPPGQHHQRTDDYRQPAVGQHFTPAFTGDHPRQNAHHRHRQRQEALGHHPHPAGDAQQHVAQYFAAAALRLRRAPEAAHRQRQPQGDHRVQHRIGANRIHQHRGEEDNRRQDSYPLITKDPPRQPGHQQGGHGDGEDRPEAYAEVIMAKQPLTDTVDPVTGNRFFEVAQAEKMRYHPVAGGQHFTADLRVAGFVGLPEQTEIERQQIIQRKQRNQRDAIANAFHQTPEVSNCSRPSQPSRPASSPRTTLPDGSSLKSAGSSWLSGQN